MYDTPRVFPPAPRGYRGRHRPNWDRPRRYPIELMILINAVLLFAALVLPYFI